MKTCTCSSVLSEVLKDIAESNYLRIEMMASKWLHQNILLRKSFLEVSPNLRWTVYLKRWRGGERRSSRGHSTSISLMIGRSIEYLGDKQDIAEGEARMICWESHQQGLWMAAPRVKRLNLYSFGGAVEDCDLGTLVTWSDQMAWSQQWLADASRMELKTETSEIASLHPSEAPAAIQGQGKGFEDSQLEVSDLNIDSVGKSGIRYGAGPPKDPVPMCRELIIFLLYKLIRSFRVEIDARGLLLIKLE